MSNASMQHRGTTDPPSEPLAEKSGPEETDVVMASVVSDEERVLSRVKEQLDARESRAVSTVDYNAELIALRDQIQEARLEDVPPLIEEMERLQQVAARRSEVREGFVDSGSPYFGRLVLEEYEDESQKSSPRKKSDSAGPKKREVLIGRGTYLDLRTGLRIVDWRDAPISRLYYRYDEGDDYDENFGGRDVEGEVVIRRSVAIVDGDLRRIGSPQGTFVRDSSGTWVRTSQGVMRLSGGQGAALRPEQYHRPGTLGVGATAGATYDKYLPEITALIDPRQFDLITKPQSGLVVIQGGAGSGKTTIGLHRLAYLAYQDRKRFRSDTMLVMVFNQALARYISKVLPSLGVKDVPVTTYERWAHKLRVTHVRHLPSDYSEDTPSVVTRFKKHPVMLKLIDAYASELGSRLGRDLREALKGVPNAEPWLEAWKASGHLPVAIRVERLGRQLSKMTADPSREATVGVGLRHAIERFVAAARPIASDVVGAWSDFLTDAERMSRGFSAMAPSAFSAAELAQVHAWCTSACALIVAYAEEQRDRLREDDDADAPEDDDSSKKGVDGRAEEDKAALDREDDALLLRFSQRIRGALRRGKEPLRYEHVLIDEAQDLSPVELAVVFGTVAKDHSVTLAGDVAQRLHMDNGFTDWRTVLSELDLSHVEVEPLRLAYRSTAEILEVSRAVLGSLASDDAPEAQRSGARVELFRFAHTGDAVGFLGESLRALMQAEPRASVAVIARYPEQADTYFRGLANAEVPHLRRIAEQDFPFKAGIDVTDVRQIKGLEFDYVVLVECSDASYPGDDESRHLLYIAMTRAAHQLWITTTGTPSRVLPEDLRAQGY